MTQVVIQRYTEKRFSRNIFAMDSTLNVLLGVAKIFSENLVYRALLDSCCFILLGHFEFIKQNIHSIFMEIYVAPEREDCQEYLSSFTKEELAANVNLT